ncbi:hypothetical protein K1719_028345 [Acacia pycnantha]|nr:hypothetical protein K1719_028345 [Acacia pycnantha]
MNVAPIRIAAERSHTLETPAPSLFLIPSSFFIILGPSVRRCSPSPSVCQRLRSSPQIRRGSCFRRLLHSSDLLP